MAARMMVHRRPRGGEKMKASVKVRKTVLREKKMLGCKAI